MYSIKIQHTVSDFDHWKLGYDGDAEHRRAAGCTSAIISRSPVNADGSTDITAILQFADQSAAHAFLDNPALAETMKTAGVIGIPDVQITELVESSSY